MPTIRPERAGASLAILETFVSKMGVVLFVVVVSWVEGRESLLAAAGWVRVKFWDVGAIPDRASAFSRKTEAEICRGALALPGAKSILCNQFSASVAPAKMRQ